MIVIAPADAESVARAGRSGSKDARWLFVGFDERVAAGVERNVGCIIARVDPRAIDQAADRLREPYLEYIGRLSGDRRDLDWWASSVPEKNPFVSRTFYRAIWLRAALDAVGAYGGSQIVVVQDEPVRAALVANLPGATAILPRWSSPRRVAARVTDWATLVARRGYFLARTLSRHVTAVALGARSRALAARLRESPLTVVQVWVDRRSFAPDGRFNYFVDFVDVADYCRRCGRAVATLPFVLRGVSFRAGLRSMMREEPRLLVPEAWLRPGDVIRAGLRLRRWETQVFPLFAGVDVSALINDDVRRERFRHRFSENVLLAALVRRLAQAGIRIERFIHTCENHTWERVIRGALREHYPAAVQVGYQAPAVSRYRLNEFVSPSEFRAAPMPDYIVSYGSYAASLLVASGYPADRVRVGAAPRYAHLLNGAHGVPFPGPRHGVVVAFSIDEVENAELLTKVYDAFGAMPEVRVALKCHPTVPFPRILRRAPFRQLPAHFTVTAETIAQAAGRSVALIYGTSGVCVEGPTHGAVPIHVYLTSCLDADPLEWAADVRHVAYTSADLRRLVEDAGRQPVAASAEWKQRLAGHFGVVSETAHRQFLA